ncbi:hypothetical protein B1R94_07340 [Mycolicibacterium litorale]|nr:hypothetical protein B1R94_07340 [Mycolicibacterium litorale]
MTACSVCGVLPRAGARFCDSCGSPLTTAEIPAEYKQVTVLFADVVRSMDIAAALGAERLREIMTELVSRATTAVRRYGGTVDKFTGDGIMAVFGAPVALEDHAFRACLAALDLQQQAQQLAVEVDAHDGVQFRLRVGLNSGQVIAGDITSDPTSYTAVGEQVGLAQRMESVAPPGGVMLSASTAHLVENSTLLGEPELVQIKGSHAPVMARRLLGTAPAATRRRTAEPTLVGRTVELGSLAGMLDDAVAGTGSVVGLVGPPGIGKSRIVREVAALAAARDVAVFTAFCESHTSEIPFHTAAALLAAALEVSGLDQPGVRARIRSRISAADADDLLLLDDLLGVSAATAVAPSIEADARRRRLTALLASTLTAPGAPTVLVIEDAHWIDDASEALLAALLEGATRSTSLVVVTYRPEYRGAFTKVPDAHTIIVEPLSTSQTSALTSELLGRHSSVQELAAHIAERAAGNPFFAEEIVRDLAERGVLEGIRAKYTCCADIADIRVPATLQAAIAARIDRLGAAAKRTLWAASVIGSRFTTELVTTLGVTPAVDELIDAELVAPAPPPPHEYAFKHPLIRTVAYESQLRSDRTELHRRLAVAIRARGCGDDRAAEVAEHLEAAGDLRAAFDWHMRAGNWLTNRDIAAARVSWRRAKDVADRVPADDPDQLCMRITPRTLLCASTYRGGGPISDTGYEELRMLCERAGDKRSLAIAMAGLPVTMTLLNRHRDGAALAAEHEQLVDSIGEPDLTVGLLSGAITAMLHAGEAVHAESLAQHVIDTAGGDTTMGELLIGSPLAHATMLRGVARCVLGRPGWTADLRDSVTMAACSDPVTRVVVTAYPFGMLLLNGALAADDKSLTMMREAFHTAEQAGDDFTLGMAGFAYGAASAARADPAGARLLEHVIESTRSQGNLFGVFPASVALAAYRAAAGDTDTAVTISRTLFDDTFGSGEMVLRGPATSVLVASLLQRGTGADLRDAREAIDRLADVPTDPDFVLFELPLLRLRALLAKSVGDVTAYHDLGSRYRHSANAVGFQGHIRLAAALI